MKISGYSKAVLRTETQRLRKDGGAAHLNTLDGTTRRSYPAYHPLKTFLYLYYEKEWGRATGWQENIQ